MPINQSLKLTVYNHKFIYQAIRLAYKVGHSTYGERLKEIEKAIKGTGWKILCNSADYKDTNKYGYKAVAFINEKTKEIHVATAGTDPKNVDDLRDDIKGVYMHGNISKIEPMKAFIDKVVNKINAEGYKYTTSGHSLGAVVSDLTAAEIVSRNLKLIESTTFDNPGSYSALDYATKNKIFSNEAREKIYSLAKYCKVINAVPNLINETNDQLATTQPKLALPKNDFGNGYISCVAENFRKLCKPLSATENMLNCYFGLNKVSGVLHKMSEAVNSAADLLKKVSVTAHSHGLSNFENCKILDVKNRGNNVVELDSLEGNKLQNVCSTGNDGILVERKNSEKELESFIVYDTYKYCDIEKPVYEVEHKSLTSFVCYDPAFTDGFDQINGACTDWSTEVD
ncbi:alpha/beta hydrolase family protein [Orientia tsutsugamushi]|uniref:Uncharacterized protein n=1 Tax=Orientia tsutsugamushi TaxID=784 RepID=A0A2U3RP02_ORITS|nr:hypothetical protein [Orientia tsutsugamushi]KJV55292.1 lipase family protein [Orientia tsutsugamushi str. Karp]SPR14965.1 Uncharacterised protein [Orientia tsutsugamushi]